MYKKLLILCLILVSLPCFAGENKVKGGISFEQTVSSEKAAEIQKKLPSLEKDFIDLNYSIEFKPLNMLSINEAVIKTAPSSLSVKGNLQNVPDNYEISFSTGRVKPNYESKENKPETLLKTNPDNKELLWAYAIQLKNEKSFDRALAIVQKALVSDPDFALAHFLKADILRNAGRLKEAVDEYLYTTQINPYCADAYYNIAKILELMDEGELALDYYKTAYQANPNDNEIRDIILQHYIDL